ncbi:MAG: hypothetical protein KAT11_00530 [Phycisphaerae bacterium]|nr:hypothetical protein [Phycisphaerae bacterium]
MSSPKARIVAESLAARVFEQECIAYPAAIQLFAQNRLQVTNNRVRVLHPPAAM